MELAWTDIHSNTHTESFSTRYYSHLAKILLLPPPSSPHITIFVCRLQETVYNSADVRQATPLLTISKCCCTFLKGVIIIWASLVVRYWPSQSLKYISVPHREHLWHFENKKPTHPPTIRLLNNCPSCHPLETPTHVRTSIYICICSSVTPYHTFKYTLALDKAFCSNNNNICHGKQQRQEKTNWNWNQN